MTTRRPPTDDGPAETRRPAARRGRFRRLLTPYLYLLPTAVLLVVLMVVPIVMVIGYSLMDNVITNQNPQSVGLSNYVDVITDPVFHTAVRNTLYFTCVSVLAHLILGLAFALLLNSAFVGRRTRALFRAVYVLPWLFTIAVVAVLWRLIMNPNGVLNYLLDVTGFIDSNVEWLANPDTALHAVTFINIWCGYPFFMISILAGLQGIPKDLYEAARVDGANAVKQFWNVTIPQLKPIIISMALLDFIWTTQQFALIWMTTGGGPINVTEMLSTFTYKLAFSRYEFSMASTSAVVILVLSMILAFFYVRHQRARD
ncbi:carbohydrate ABC transporter permease [Jiangella gansuensis]|uniref:carbohydrate ABC transporter permease n=1 Tax=Jiangella gansuensis TaxID=281473 RepID=UPI00047C0549